MSTCASTPNTVPEKAGAELDALIHVAAGVLVNAAGEVLLARRPAGAHQGGLWEFPGGKVAAGESACDALARELDEELGIAVRDARPLIRVRHAYSDRTVLLDVWRVGVWHGEPVGREGQPLVWVAPGALDGRPMPAADVFIVRAVRLPELCLVTPEPGHDRDAFLAGLAASLDAGVRLVQLRAPRLAAEDYLQLARESLALCQRAGAALLLNTTPALARRLPGTGLHLNAARLRQSASRPVPADTWLSASCHDALELAMAQRLGVDFALLGPVLHTASHPDAASLGWERFAALVEKVNLPVYALAGLGPADLSVAWRHGAQGVAAIRGLWGPYGTKAAAR